MSDEQVTLSKKQLDQMLREAEEKATQKEQERQFWNSDFNQCLTTYEHLYQRFADRLNLAYQSGEYPFVKYNDENVASEDSKPTHQVTTCPQHP